jgi:hypothetical protein
MAEEYSGGYRRPIAERNYDHMLEWVEHVTRFKPSAMIRNPEEHQLLLETLTAQRNGRFYYKPMAALGRCLMNWGEWLHQQYDRAEQIPLELPPLEFASREDTPIEM